jgi:uncharacterized membrane protein
MFCQNCGKELLEESKFCLNCGTKVGTVDSNADMKNNISKGYKQDDGRIIIGTTNANLMVKAREALKGRWGLAVGLCFVFLILYSVVVIIPFVPYTAFVLPAIEANEFIDVNFATFIILTIICSVVCLAVSGPLMLGIFNTMLLIARGTEVRFSQLFGGFNRYGVSMLAFLCMSIFVSLWSILLIIPGYIAIISYSMTFFIIADNPNIKALKKNKKSKQIMMGYKGKFFGLCCRFIGWTLVLLLLLTVLSIGLSQMDFYMYMNDYIIGRHIVSIVSWLVLLTFGIGLSWLVSYIYVSMAKFYDDIKKD